MKFSFPYTFYSLSPVTLSKVSPYVSFACKRGENLNRGSFDRKNGRRRSRDNGKAEFSLSARVIVVSSGETVIGW